MEPARYDTIGVGYRRYRQPDPHIAAAIEAALDGAATVVDVGSGTGSYQPRGRKVIAVEPSRTMLDQRGTGAAPAVQSVAEHLSFPDMRFDAALAVLTTHHWPDHLAGLREMARVAHRQVFLTWDPDIHANLWLFQEYLPEMVASEGRLRSLRAITDVVAVDRVETVPVPALCTDGFCGAYWRRPHAYLDPEARLAISAFSRCDPANVNEAMGRLERDLNSGRWQKRHHRLLELDELDLGYRLVVAAGMRTPQALGSGVR